MRILAIETACPPGSVALCDSSETVYRPIESTRRTTETFALEIQGVLRDLELSPKEIDAVATTSGPGSFTGLRIGVTASKVFAHVTGAKLVAVDTLELLAFQCPVEGEVEVVLDAQRGELFAARFRKSANAIETLRPVAIIPASKWIADHSTEAYLTGLGLKKIEDQIESDRILNRDAWTPRADTLALLARRKIEEGLLTNPIDLVPQYFRRSAAEEKADAAEENAAEGT